MSNIQGNTTVPNRKGLPTSSSSDNSPTLSSTSNKVSPERETNRKENIEHQSKKEYECAVTDSSGIQRTSPSANNPIQIPHPDYNKVYTLSPPERRDYSVFPSTPQYDPTLLDISEPLSPFFRSSPKVTPSRNLAFFASHKSSFPPPKYNMNPKDDSIRYVAEESITLPTSATATTSNIRRGGLDQIIRATESTELENHHTALGKRMNENEEKDNTSPPREVSHRNSKVSVVSPPEGDVPRKGPTSTTLHASGSGPGYDIPNGEYCECKI